jgi:hypothetical protein
MSDKAMRGSEETLVTRAVLTETSGRAPQFVFGIGASAGGLGGGTVAEPVFNLARQLQTHSPTRAEPPRGRVQG